MKNRYLKKIISVTSCAVITALLIVALFLCSPHIDDVPQTEGEAVYLLNHKEGELTVSVEPVTAEIGKDFTATRISDLGRLKKITKVNYVADKFVDTNCLSPDIQIVDLTKPFNFAEKGTLIFVIMNLDPFAKDFYEQAERLAEYKIGENWCFTLSLPKIFSASNVYRKTTLVARNGDIENYDFIEFNTSYDKKTDSFSSKTENTLINLNFYTRRTTMEDAFNAAQVITVHYQSTGNAYSGIVDCPLIGVESAVQNINKTSRDLLFAFAILAAVVFAVLIALSVLKRSKEFIAAIVWIFGIFALLLSRFMLSGATEIPLLWTALSLSTPFVILGGVLLIGNNFGKLPTKYIFPALSATGALLAFICPYIPFGAAAVMRIVYTVIKGIGAVALLAFIGFSIFRKDDKHGILQMICAVIIAVAICASLFMPQVFPSYCNPIFWLCAITVILTFVSVFMLFKETEKANAYLTSNLHREVERQVKDIKAVISERDKLLQFVSHDMKKPLVNSASLIETLIEREKDVEQTKTLQIVKQNTARVVSNLSEIAVYAKFNYIAEPSQVVNLSALCGELYEFHQPDCNANGIVLKNLSDKSVNAFVKKQGLENVISNLIINAVEHANCSTITLSVNEVKNKVKLSVSDNGKGIDKNMDVFKPYISENNSETGGVGLYICKSIIESMNGELDFKSGSEGTTFYISLLKA